MLVNIATLDFNLYYLFIFIYVVNKPINFTSPIKSNLLEKMYSLPPSWS